MTIHDELLSYSTSDTARIRDWRVIYELDPERGRLVVLDIGPRGSVYDRKALDP
jgi:mRNA-degrading endonuclease RelE of RelBE toxin-antitoxin system